MSLQSEIRMLGKLKPNWDSYGANPIRLEVIDMALEYAKKIALLHIPKPSVVPLPNGGIQFEWHQSGYDAEFCLGGEPVSVYWRSHTTGRECEKKISEPMDLGILRGILSTARVSE